MQDSSLCLHQTGLTPGHDPCMQVRQGYLWVWGDSGALAPLQAAAKPPLLIPNIRDNDIYQTTDGGPVLSGAYRYMRDVPYRYV